MQDNINSFSAIQLEFDFSRLAAWVKQVVAAAKAEFVATIQAIANKLTEAGCRVKIWNNKRVYVQSTPAGGKAEYGFLIAGDNGTTGSCQSITKRRGTVAELLRA